MLGKLYKLLPRESKPKPQVMWMKEFKSVGMFWENQKINILAQKCDFKIANLYYCYYKKIY